MHFPFDINYVAIHAFSGMLFLMFGAVLYVLPRRLNTLRFLPHLNLLVCFGVAVGAHELLNMASEFFDAAPIILFNNRIIEFTSEIIAFVSFLFLFEFGRLSLADSFQAGNTRASVFFRSFKPYILSGVGVLAAMFILPIAPGFLVGQVIMFGVSGALMAALTFVLAGRECHLEREKDNRSLLLYIYAASIGFVLYALSIGSITYRNVGVELFPLARDRMYDLVGMPVYLLHASCSIILMVAIVHIVRSLTFNLSRRERIQFIRAYRLNKKLLKSISLCESVEFSYRAAQLELSMSSALFESNVAVMFVGANWVITRVNQAFEVVTGYSSDEVVGRDVASFRLEFNEADIFEGIKNEMLSNGKWVGDLSSRRKNGELYTEELTVTVITDVNDQNTGYVFGSVDVSSKKFTEEEIHRMAFHDQLTRLPNRRLLMDRLSHSFDLSARSGSHGALFFIDLDNFKKLNDTKGHDFGDALLVEVAHRLINNVRDGDTVSRLGGDEFVVLLESLSEDRGQAIAQSKHIAEKMIERISEKYSLMNHDYYCTCSVGIALFNGRDLLSIEDIFRHADAAMYGAKSTGRNRANFFDPKMQQLLEQRVKMEADLRHALSRGEIELHYQPQVDGLRHTIGVEALVRWVTPDGNFIPPSVFIPLAEDTGLILPVGWYVLERACKKLKEWELKPEFCLLTMSVNISSMQFKEACFADNLIALIKSLKIKPERLKIELTESIFMHDIEGVITKMNAIRSLGVNFSIDDFGTGYSSLSYLRKLPATQLKIDQSFVRDINNEDGKTIVQTIIGMAKNLKMNVIAEGVETDEQFDFLVRNSCEGYQGYLFGKPLNGEEVEAFVIKNHKEKYTISDSGDNDIVMGEDVFMEQVKMSENDE